jgi:hypothetical protein
MNQDQIVKWRGVGDDIRKFKGDLLDVILRALA